MFLLGPAVHGVGEPQAVLLSLERIPCGLIETWVSFFGSLSKVQLLVERGCHIVADPIYPS